MVAPTKDAAGHVEGYEIFIKYLPQEATAPELKAWFGEAGEIVGDVRLMTNPATGAPPLPAPPLPPPPLPPPPLPPPSPPPPPTPPHLLTGKCKGIGWVTFATEAGHAQAMGWDGSEYGGRRLAITSATKQHTGFRPSMQAPGTHTPALLQHTHTLSTSRAPPLHLPCTSCAPPVHCIVSCGTHAPYPALRRCCRRCSRRWWRPTRPACTSTPPSAAAGTRALNPNPNPNPTLTLTLTLTLTRRAHARHPGRALAQGHAARLRHGPGRDQGGPRALTLTLTLTLTLNLALALTLTLTLTLTPTLTPTPTLTKVGRELEAADGRFAVHHSAFGEMGAVLGPRNITPAGVFFDLGISPSPSPNPNPSPSPNPNPNPRHLVAAVRRGAPWLPARGRRASRPALRPERRGARVEVAAAGGARRAHPYPLRVRRDLRRGRRAPHRRRHLPRARRQPATQAYQGVC
eukprot:scaffold100688_cov48-Phaeocystis_antarctica.AAC.2